MQVLKALAIEKATANLTAHQAQLTDIAAQAAEAVRGIARELGDAVKAGERGLSITGKIPVVCDCVKAFEEFLLKAELSAPENNAITITDCEYDSFIKPVSNKVRTQNVRVSSD